MQIMINLPCEKDGDLVNPGAQAAVQTALYYGLLFKHVLCMDHKTHNGLYQLMILVCISHIYVSSSVFPCLF